MAEQQQSTVPVREHPRMQRVISRLCGCDESEFVLRVDEHCHVYAAEESGHLAAFGALPRLSLVTS